MSVPVDVQSSDPTPAEAAAPFAHTPYDGTKKPFSVALAPLDLAEWIEPDRRLGEHLTERARLIAEKRDIVLREEEGSRTAQREALELLVAHLLERYPDQYRLEGRTLCVAATRRRFDLDDTSVPPFEIAGHIVADDLLLLTSGPNGYRLVAAVLCFPSAWSLAEKFGQSLDELHAAVPGYPSKLARVMNRIFDNLQVEQPVWRVNWSIYPDEELHHPESKERPRDWFSDPDDLSAQAFIRVERQTLRRLPVSRDLLFTVRIHVDPFEAFRRHPQGAELAAALREQILGLDADQLAYKALTEHRDAVVGALDRIAGGQ